MDTDRKSVNIHWDAPLTQSPSSCDYLERNTTVIRIYDSDELLITDRAQYFCSIFALANFYQARRTIRAQPTKPSDLCNSNKGLSKSQESFEKKLGDVDIEIAGVQIIGPQSANSILKVTHKFRSMNRAALTRRRQTAALDVIQKRARRNNSHDDFSLILQAGVQTCHHAFRS